MEGIMETLTPGQIFLVCVGVLLALAGFINTVGSAIERLSKARDKAKAPNAAQDARLDDLERRLEAAEKKLEKGQRHFEAIDASNRVTQVALLALLDHGIDGNNIDQMQHAKEELQTHLINR